MTQVDEWTPSVLEKLNETLKPDEVSKLITLMKTTGAILSGGFVLQAIAKYSTYSDLDLYVPVEKMPTFLSSLISDVKLTYFFHFDATIYCRSFLRKNGIRRVYNFNDPLRNLAIDVMSVRKRKTPAEVCSNFDLTFCQVWFDGTSVYATHPDHIREKKGFLQPEYIQTFVTKNQFLKDRILKYKGRGFTVEYDPSTTTTTLPPISDILTSNPKCTTEQTREVLLPVWFKRAATHWLTSKNKSTFVLPFGKSLGSSATRNQLFLQDGPHSHRLRPKNIRKFKIPDDEGYDSEDMDTSKFMDLAVKSYTPENNDLASVPLDQVLIYGRQLFLMIKEAFTEKSDISNFHFLFENNYKEIFDWKNRLKGLEAGIPQGEWTIDTIPRVKKIIDNFTKEINNYNQFVDYLRNASTREGTDFAGDEGHLYDIHAHPMDGAITQESMEAYLQQFIRLPDKSAGVPCYYKPTPAVRGEPEPLTNCQTVLTLNEIEAIVSPEFYRKFSVTERLKTGLDVSIPLYDLALPNVKSMEEGFGEEYHETMCPFCLQPISRKDGCSYMTHENPKRLPYDDTPYCQKEFVVNDLLQKYRSMGRTIYNNEETPGRTLHIEICVECGRPCLGHQHFDITSDVPKLVPPVKMPDPANPERMIDDYATCTGGGRAELFARMLAVRDVYKTGGFKDTKEERKKAAWAADRGAKSAMYLARGKAILDKPPAERKFNRKVPAIKKYNDVAYNDVSEENARAAALAAMNSDENDAVIALALRTANAVNAAAAAAPAAAAAAAAPAAAPAAPAAPAANAVDRMTIPNLIQRVVNARQIRANAQGIALPGQNPVYSADTPAAWKPLIQTYLDGDIENMFESPDRFAWNIIAHPIMEPLDITDEQKDIINIGATHELKNSNQYKIWERLAQAKRDEGNAVIENLTVALDQIYADCINVYMAKVRQRLIDIGFPNAVIPMVAPPVGGRFRRHTYKGRTKVGTRSSKKTRYLQKTYKKRKVQRKTRKV